MERKQWGRASEGYEVNVVADPKVKRDDEKWRGRKGPLKS